MSPGPGPPIWIPASPNSSRTSVSELPARRGIRGMRREDGLGGGEPARGSDGVVESTGGGTLHLRAQAI